jgi:Na+/H+ antiporter NhaA
MTPSDFTFTLTVPRDAQLVVIVRAVATHAVSYAEVDAARGEDFVARVAEASVRKLSAGGPHGCVVTFSADASGLHATLDDETVRTA